MAAVEDHSTRGNGVLEAAQLGAIINMSQVESSQPSRSSFDAPAFVMTAAQSTVREPSDSEVAGWSTLADVASWAKPKGDILWPPSMAGSLVHLLAGDDDGK